EAVVARRQHRRPLVAPHDAALLDRAVLRAVEFMPLVARRALGVALLRFLRERRHAALRSDDHRSPHAERDLRLAAIEAELRELVVRLGAAALRRGQR